MEFFLLFGNAVRVMESEIVKEIVCLSCKKTVIAKLLAYGDGYAATCPSCQRLAYCGK